MDSLQVIVEADHMKISTGPGVNQYGILAGLVSLGAGAAFFGSDYFVVKCMYILACFTLGISFLKNWEKCVFDKVLRKSTFYRVSFYQKFLKFKKERDLQLDFQEILSVLVKTVKLDDDSCPWWTVTLLLKSGVSLQLLETFKTSSKSECDLLAEKIQRFLKLTHLEHLQNQNDFGDFRHWNDADSSSGTSTDQDSSDIEDLASIKETLISEIK